MRQLFLFMCVAAMAQFSWAEPYCPEKIQNSYECYLHRERELSTEYWKYFYREGKTLNIRLANGRVKSFKDVQQDDNQETDSIKAYALVRYFPTVNYWLVALQFYEGSNYLLLNGKDGTTTTVEGEALLSPDRTRFAVSNFDIEAESSPNVFSIYRLEGPRLVQEFAVKPSDWGATEVAWKDHSTVRFLKTSLVGNGYATQARVLIGILKPTGKGKMWKIK